MSGTLEANLFYNDFRAVLSQNEELFKPWSGVMFRSVSPQYARPGDILSGHGAYQAGGRWNAPGIYAIYGSLEPGLAADESFNFLLQHFGWQNRDIPPRMLVGIRASLRVVLDLTDPGTCPYSAGFGRAAFGGPAQNEWRAAKRMANARKAALKR